MKDLASTAPNSTAAFPSDGIALGLGLTNECNLSCAFCYRNRSATRSPHAGTSQVGNGAATRPFGEPGHGRME